MTVTVKAMDTQRWNCRIQIFQFNGSSFDDEPEADRAWHSDSRVLSRLRRPVGRLNAELSGVLGVQSLPATELHRVGADNAPNGIPGELPLEHIEADMPARSAHRDESAVDVVP